MFMFWKLLMFFLIGNRKFLPKNNQSEVRLVYLYELGEECKKQSQCNYKLYINTIWGFSEFGVRFPAYIMS